MMQRRCLSLSIARLVVFCCALAFAPLLWAATIAEKPIISPDTIPVGQASQLTVTSQVTGDATNPVIAIGVNLLRVDANNTTIATIGVMRDDGTAGDAVAGDGIFTLRFTVTESTAGEVRLRVSAAFRGVLRRVLSEVTSVRVEGGSNGTPVANAGEDLNALTSAVTTLDGSESYDPDNSLITFRWALVEAPQGSTAALVDATLPNPQFVATVPGRYVFDLIVNDGQTDSAPDRVNVTVTSGNAPPNARAGRDRNALVGTAVNLDGSESDDPNGTALTFSWSFTSVPSGSNLINNSIAGTDTPTPQFTPDVAGTFVLTLRVSDGTLTDDDTIQVVASQPNVAPYADAGPDGAVKGGSPVSLDGSLSTDPDGGPSPLSFSWSLVARPAGSALTSAGIVNATTATPQFTPDGDGAYIFRLKVSDGQKSDENNVLIIVDATPPTLQFTNPTDGLVVGDSTPTVTITFSDTGSGLDLASYKTTINGVDVTAGTTVTPSGATYTVTSPLPAGDNNATASIADLAGNVRSVTIHFSISVFRAIADCAPTTGDAPLTVRFRTRAEFTGGSIVQYRWDFQGDGVDDEVDAVAQDYTSTFQQLGRFVAKLEVTNNRGETASDTCTINVGGGFPTASAQANPSNGPIPLTVTFTGTGTKKGGTIVKHEWDFEGDGVFDRVITNFAGSKPTNITFTINHATCSAFNEFQFFLNNTSIGTANGTVGCVCNGEEPTFSITDSTALSHWNTQGANILRVDVGFGVVVGYIRATIDGTSSVCIFDPSGNDCAPRNLCNASRSGGSYSASTADAVGTSSQVVHTYTQEGTYKAIFRVTDNEGMTATASAISTAIRARPPGSPSVDATATPTNGTAPLTVAFAGSATDDGTIVKWEWDFDGDGTFEFSSATSPATSFTYAKAGVFGATLRGTDNVGLTSSDVVEIAVGITASLSIPDNSIDPTAGETATINTSISAEVAVRLILKDQGGAVVRTLVNKLRTPGSYSDTWDGKDDDGKILPQAPYFAVLEYEIGGKTLSVDLTNSTGGDRYNPSRNGLPRTFRPFEDDHLTINFTLPEASEVQAFIGLFNTDTRFVTLLDRVPLGAGTHTIKWDGLDSDGKLAVAPPGDTFLFGIWGFALADNAIFLQQAPVLSNVTVDPNYFDPATPNFLTPTNPTATVKFDLNKTAEVELTVTNLTTGRVLRRIRQANTAAGTGRTIAWDGKADNGLFADKSDYRLAVRAIDSTGSASLTRYALVRVFY